MEQLRLLESRCELDEIELYYGDESQVSEEGYVPYGWQFRDEKVSVASAKATHINCFGLLTRDNKLFYGTTTENINSDFVVEQLERFSLKVKKPTVVVLDNARIHRSKKVMDRQKAWEARNLYLFFLPPYSPHLNIIERLWKELKGRWLSPQYYTQPDLLYYQTNLALSAVGKSISINYKPFKINLN